MAYAYCPICRSCFRYTAKAPGAPAWLKQVALQIGRGEQAAFLCMACWFEPEVNDIVEIINPPYDQPEILPGAQGKVVSVVERPGTSPLFEVEAAEENGAQKWQATFYRRAIKAGGATFKETVRLHLSLPEKS
jgi:hypothetical protein